MPYKDISMQINEAIKGLVTSDNAEAIAKLNGLVGELSGECERLEKDAVESKNALVRVVSSTPVIQQPHADTNPPTHEDVPPDLDTLIADGLNEITRARSAK